MLGERSGHTLQTTALVNEAYLRLVVSSQVQWRDRAHFLAVSARLMRRILVDSARSRRSGKRGGAQTPARFDDAVAVFETRSRDLAALDDALNDLEAKDPVKSRLVELRFFGGLSMAEIAAVIGVTEDAARWQWRLARAWLGQQLGEDRRHGE
jgi:RNA polymerase sigma factor (TIGR02999 family)